ncbi:MAG: hypothetical protein VB036_02200 [Propionicimonas sp.]|nr:hypothetical protein [Propionicimonas sp.]
MVLLDLGSDWVTPSWLPLALAVLLLAVIGFLYWSMRRNLNKISVPPRVPSPPSSPPTPPTPTH